MKKAKLIKLESLRNDDLYFIKPGEEIIGEFKDWPKVGQKFYFDAGDDKYSYYEKLETSNVIEFLNENTFKTKYSIYEIVDLVAEERKNKLNILLKN